MSESKPPEDADALEEAQDVQETTDTDDEGPEADAPASAGGHGGDADDASSSGEHADDEEEEDDEDDKFDLDDLDELGVDGVVARMGGDEGQVAAQAARRPPWLSGLVLLASVGLLVWLWPDFRYWLQPAEPIPVGAASEWVENGKVPSGWLGSHVALEGTPNVRWAMLRGSADGEQKSFFDLTEAPGQLFVITPQVSGKHETRRYPGHFEGRLMRLGDDPLAMTRMAQLFAQENVSRVVDITGEALSKARSADSLEFVSENEGTVELAPEDTIRFVAHDENKRVLLGGLSFRSGEDAEAAVAELGYPYFRLPDLKPPKDPAAALSNKAVPKDAPAPKLRADSYRFVVRIPDGQATEARAKLQAKMVREADPTDHRHGVSVFDRQATYVAPAGAVTIEGGDVVFPYGDNTTPPGYVAQGDKLVERQLAQGKMRIPLAALAEVRLETPIVVDPDGYLLVDGFRPGDLWDWALAFLGVLAITLLNGGWLLFGLVRR